MKSIATINTQFPTVEDSLDYHSGASLLDFDITVFNPRFPYLSVQSFSSGGHCISIDSSKRTTASMQHWNRELLAALEAGKTVFVLLSELEDESFATGTSSPRKGQTTYHTTNVNNYSAIPVDINVRNAKGKKIIAKQQIFKPLLQVLQDIVEYQVVVKNEKISEGFVAKDGSRLGGIFKLKDIPGNLVYLPYFNLEHMTEETDDEEVWTEDALKKSHGIVTQLLEIDRVLRAEDDQTPAPDWVEDFERPAASDALEAKIGQLDTRIEKLEADKSKNLNELAELERHKILLFGTGPALESAIEEALKLLAYKVEGFREGDLEIDHVIESPDGFRMVGEAEGKDSSAVGISKFRQLESNINEDFERDNVDEPAKGVLFGNSFRLTEPSKREGDFTEKCYKNAARLGTALVKTADLYPVVLYVLNNPKNDSYRAECRDAIGNTKGNLVKFPEP
jgi:hypothetical protein